MANRIGISYKDYEGNLIQHTVYNTKELKKKLIELRRYSYAGFGYEIAVRPYYNYKKTAKDWREFSRIRDIVMFEDRGFRYTKGANNYAIVNPQRDEIWVPNFYKN